MLWLLILLICIGALIVVIYWFLKKKLTPSPTGQISENIVSIKNGIVNSFFYSKESDKIFIDTGMSKKRLKKGLRRMKIDEGTILDVFLTHLDPDHTGGLSLFKNARIYFGKESKMENIRRIVENPDNLITLEDNEVINVGKIKIQAISTPGHRNGHFSYLIDNRFLFTGDLIRLKAGKVKPFYKLISSDPKQMQASIKKVTRMENIEMLITAHSGYTTEFGKAIEEWKIDQE